MAAKNTRRAREIREAQDDVNRIQAELETEIAIMNAQLDAALENSRKKREERKS
jgi:hypothetical protein